MNILCLHIGPPRYSSGPSQPDEIFKRRNEQRISLRDTGLSAKLQVGACIFLLTVGLLFMCNESASGQTAVQAVATKDPQAVAALNLALTALGGPTAFAAIQDSTVSGQSQPSDPSLPTDQFIWKSVGMAIRQEYAMSDGTHISAVIQGKGQSKDPSGQIAPIDGRASLTIFPYHLPGVVLLSLLNSANATLSLISDPTNDGNLIHVRSIRLLSHPLLSPLTRQDWLFDPVSGLPVRVSFCLPDLKSQRLDGTATVTFTGWQSASSVTVSRSRKFGQGYRWEFCSSAA